MAEEALAVGDRGAGEIRVRCLQRCKLRKLMPAFLQLVYQAQERRLPVGARNELSSLDAVDESLEAANGRIHSPGGILWEGPLLALVAVKGPVFNGLFQGLHGGDFGPVVGKLNEDATPLHIDPPGGSGFLFILPGMIV